jgi:hypothetical protein
LQDEAKSDVRLAGTPVTFHFDDGIRHKVKDKANLLLEILEIFTHMS